MKIQRVKYFSLTLVAGWFSIEFHNCHSDQSLQVVTQQTEFLRLIHSRIRNNHAQNYLSNDILYDPSRDKSSVEKEQKLN